MNYSIHTFWKQHLAAVGANGVSCTSAGWSSIATRTPSFVEADLSLREGFDDIAAPVWLVAAPGAVGKSTFARELCASTGAVYVDLAQATAVGGNYVVGGLFSNNLLDRWKAGTTTLVIDALDEARLRVTQAAFEDFLTDVVNVAKQGSLPLLLIGRVGIVDECWLQLNDKTGSNCPIFDIQFFSQERAVDFVMSALSRLAQTTHPDLVAPLATHRAEYQRAVEQIVGKLVEASSADGNRFAGYAPVLEAVAKVVAGETNPAQIGTKTLPALAGRILDRLASEILTRESRKLVAQLQAAVNGFPSEGVYEEGEQLSRLAGRIFSVAPTSIAPTLPPHCVGPYEHAVTTFIEQHPFLDGTGLAPSGAVFSACIVAHALRSDDAALAAAAERYARDGHHAPNPFLFDFYRAALNESKVVPAAHIGTLYESVQAKAAPGDISRLSVEGDTEAEWVDVEITVSSDGGTPTRIELQTKNGETLRFGRRVAGVSVDAEGMGIKAGDGGQLEFMAPVTIEANSLKLNCTELIVKPEPRAASSDGSHAEPDNLETGVALEAKTFAAGSSAPLVTVRPGTDLKVTWPGSRAYPWTAFSDAGAPTEDPVTAEALRALRRLVIAFRSHSKGSLARYNDKIEHARMTKGEVGNALREKLVKDGVLSLKGNMYYLDPKALGAQVGLSFLDAKLKRYGSQVRRYVQNLL